MKRRRWFSGLLCVFLALLIICAVLNLLFGFHIFETSRLLSHFPCRERLTSAEGIRAVITALGAVCFVLSYINSAKIQRVKGILMEDIIFRCYPFYGVVFLFHGCFAALGLYSSAAKALRTAYICLVGIIFCLTYLLRMAYQVCFSQKGRDHLVRQYITDLLQYPFEDASKQVSQAYQLGQYVGMQYNAYDIRLDEPICRSKKAENIMISMTSLLMPEAGPDGPLPEAFPRIFAANDAPSPLPQYILFSLPSYASCCEEFQKNIRACSVLWGNILSKVKTEERQAAFVSEALLCSPSTAVLCCSLVHYLHSIHVQYHTGKEGWDTCARFLARVSNTAKKAAPQFAWENRQKVSLCCRDMSVVFLCLAFLEEANSPETCLEEAFLAQIHSEPHTNRSLDFCMYWDEMRLLQYLSFAYEIFLSLASPGIGIPCRKAMYQQVSAILERLQQCLNAK